MKNQRMKTNTGFRFYSVVMICLMISLLMGAFAVTTFASGGDVLVNLEVNLDFSESSLTLVGGVYTKPYDGTTAVTGIRATNAALGGVAEGDDVRLAVEKAEFDNATVADATKIRITLKLIGEDAANYTVSSIELPARIVPAELYWEADKTASAEAIYQPNTSTYNGLKVENLPALVNKAGNAVQGVSVVATTPYTVSVQASAAGDYRALVPVTLDDPNYTVSPAPVTVTVHPLELATVAWQESYTFEYGDKAASDIKVFGYDADGNEYALAVTYPEGYGAVGSHVIGAAPVDPSLRFAEAPSKTVTITKKICKVKFEGATYIASSEGAQNPQIYGLAVEMIDEGETLPPEVLTAIAYTVNDQPFTGASACGVYNVVAALPTSSDYSFVDADGNEITTLSATLMLNKTYVAAGAEGATHQVILTKPEGLRADAALTVTIPTEFDRKAIRGFHVYKAYTVSVSNVDGSYTIAIPIEDALYAKNCKALTDRDLYLYDAATATAVKVVESTGFKVSVANGYYQIDGVTGTGERTFILSPVYETPFLLSAPGIALLVLMILLLIALLFFIGLYLRRAQEAQNAPEKTEESVEEVTEEPAENGEEEETAEEETAEEETAGEATAEDKEASED